MNVFAGQSLRSYFEGNSPEGKEVKKLKSMKKIMDQLDEELNTYEKYTLIKSSAVVESNYRELLRILVSSKDKEERMHIVRQFLEKDAFFEFPLEEEGWSYAFEDLPSFEIKRHHWSDEKHPKIELLVDDAEYNLLKESFSEDSKFPESKLTLVLMIVDAIENAEQIKPGDLKKNK